MEVLDKDVNGTNDDKEEDRTKNTKEAIPKYLSFFKGVMDSYDLLPLHVNRETLQGYKMIKFISKKLVRNSIEMLRNLAEKDESKEEKDDEVDDKTKGVDINENREIVETDND